MSEDSYNEFLLSKIYEIFPKKEAVAFIESNEISRPITIRTNLSLISRKELISALLRRKIECDVLDWCEEVIVIFSSKVPLGATPEYLAGYYIIQGANSFLPVLNMELSKIKDSYKVVDLCGAPGGKSTHIGALMENRGTLFVNELNKDRCSSLISNLHRMHVSNSIISNIDGLKFDVGKVERVLLDAPCSGTGIISKDPSVKTSKTEKEIKDHQKLQKKLILHAFDMLKNNGILVYSTCSILVEENEEVIDFLLSKRKNAKVSDLDVAIGKDGFSKFRGVSYNGTISKSKRIFPHVQNMDGFYYCKIKKVE
ncbi:NOP2 [Hepatospora eriocheir]|uniref:NOP2 n=1 Tax=Hepatospora eriocheir TaxID=1081669 RepID=A0A1X0QFC2_9MICR|nr:NOP2 [Hepatospora eriocheir]